MKTTEKRRRSGINLEKKRPGMFRALAAGEELNAIGFVYHGLCRWFCKVDARN
jgi:hypothetical protein